MYKPTFPHEFRDTPAFNLVIHHVYVYIHPDIMYMCIYLHVRVYSSNSRSTVHAGTPPSRSQDNPNCNMLTYCILSTDLLISYICVHTYISTCTQGTVMALLAPKLLPLENDDEISQHVTC